MLQDAALLQLELLLAALDEGMTLKGLHTVQHSMGRRTAGVH